MAQVDCPVLNDVASRASDLAAGLHGAAMMQATQLQNHVTALQDKVTQLHDQAMAQVTQFHGKVAELQNHAMQLHDQATAQMAQFEEQVTDLQSHATQLQDQATAQMAQVQGQATDLQNKATQLQSQATAQMALLQGKAKNLPGQAMAQMAQLRGKAAELHGQATQLPGQAMAQVQGKAADLQSHGTQLRDEATAQAAQFHDQAMAHGTQLRDRAMAHITRLRDRATALRNQAMQMHGRAMAQVTQLHNQAMQMRTQAMAMGAGLHDKLTGMLAVPPALGALMQEASAQPLPDKERARESDLAPFADDEEPPEDESDERQHDEPHEGGGDAEPMEFESRLQQELQRRLAQQTEQAEGRARDAAEAAAAGHDMPDLPAKMPDEQSIEAWAHGQVQSYMTTLQKRFQPPPLPAFDLHPEAPPYDDPTAACLAGFAQTNNMMQDLIGKTMLDGPGELQELVGSFQECAAAIPSIDPSQLDAMNVAGAMAMAVESVRSRFNIDLLQQGAGAQLAGLLSRARSLDPSGLQQAAARRIAKWLPLAQFAQSLKLPVNGPGALARIGDAARWMSTVPMPDSGMAQKKLGEMLGHMSNADAVKRVFNVDPSAKGAGAALAPMLSRVRSNADQAMSQATGAARQAKGIADNLSRSSVAQVAKIDRSQAKDLALGKMRQAASPVLTHAAPVLSTLQSVKQATGKQVTMPGSGRWRRS